MVLHGNLSDALFFRALSLKEHARQKHLYRNEKQSMKGKTNVLDYPSTTFLYCIKLEYLTSTSKYIIKA